MLGASDSIFFTLNKEEDYMWCNVLMVVDVGEDYRMDDWMAVGK